MVALEPCLASLSCAVCTSKGTDHLGGPALSAGRHPSNRSGRPRLWVVTRREHPSRVVRLAAGQLVGYPPSAEEDCTLWFALTDAPDEWEGVLGKRQSDDTAEVVGIPVFVYDVNLGDVVRTVASADGAAVVSELVADAGNYTFRVFFEDEAASGEQWKPLMIDLEKFGCWFDTFSENLIAVSVDAENSQAVADYLAAR